MSQFHDRPGRDLARAAAAGRCRSASSGSCPGSSTGRSASAARRAPGRRSSQLDGQAWTTDKDGILLALLASEILAVTGKSPSQLYAELTAEFGDPAYARVDAAATQGAEGAARQAVGRPTSRPTPSRATRSPPASREAPGNGAAIGGVKVVTEHAWFAARPSRHRGRLQDLRRVVPRARAPAPRCRPRRRRSSTRRSAVEPVEIAAYRAVSRSSRSDQPA